MSHGLLELLDGRLVRVLDRAGAVHATLTWRGATLDRLVVPGAIVHGAVRSDPLLGDVHVIDGATTMSAISWAAPTEIPAIAAPGRLGPGSGAAILNVLAQLAVHAGVTALRYAGPYPTPALWRSLRRSFRTEATEATFTRDVLDRALRIARDELPIDFVPAPHERLAIPGGHVELRWATDDEPASIERVVIDHLGYAEDGSPTRLVRAGAEEPAAYHAEVWFGDACWARVASLASDGSLLDGPHPIPAAGSDVIGQPFPAPLRAALADLVVETIVAPLAARARAMIAATPLRWADLGPRAAARDATGFAVHAALWVRLAPLGLARLALGLAEALGPVVTGAVVAELATPSR